MIQRGRECYWGDSEGRDGGLVIQSGGSVIG